MTYIVKFGTSAPIFYYNDQIHFDVDKTIQEVYTWNYDKRFEHIPAIHCAHLISGCEIEDICPNSLKKDWTEQKKRMKAVVKSFQSVGINIEDKFPTDYICGNILLSYLQTKMKIVKSVFEKFSKPGSYDHLLNSEKLLDKIRNQVLNIDDPQYKKKPVIDYNIFGTVTGRLSTRKGSFPILNLAKSKRSIIKPVNDFFVSFDYNAAELRTVFGLQGTPQPQEDLHMWIGNNVLKRDISREEIKKEVFSWLYDLKKKHPSLNELCNRKKIVKKHWNKEKKEIETIFGRVIKCDHEHSLNYLMQSVTSDIVLEQSVDVDKYLRSNAMRSFIAFLIHDDVVLDVKGDEIKNIATLEKIFSNTRLGKFKTNISIGKDFGNMKQINI